jgi:hypothetical protein
MLDLPGDRIWTVNDLAAFLKVGKGWVYARTKKSCQDPPPRCPGIADIRFDTHSRAFQLWLARQIGADVEMEDTDLV